MGSKMANTLQRLSNDQLRGQLKVLVKQERKILSAVIEHVAEVERRKLYLTWRYESLFSYLVEELGYSEKCAYSRMRAAQLVLQVPDIKDKVEAGELNLTQLNQASRDFRNEEKTTGEKVSNERKAEVLDKIKGKNTRQSQIILDANLKLSPREQPVELRHRKDESVDVAMNIPKDLYEDLGRVKELYSHISPSADLVEVIRLMVKDVRKLRDPLLKKSRASAGSKKNSSEGEASDSKAEFEEATADRQVQTSRLENLTQSFGRETKHSGKDTKQTKVYSTSKKRTPITRATRIFVIQRDKGECRVCGSTYFPEVDHIIPVPREDPTHPKISESCVVRTIRTGDHM